MGKDKIKIPKEIGGVKIPKELRRAAKQAVRIAADPVARQMAIAALGAAMTAILESKAARRRAHAAADAARAASRPQTDNENGEPFIRATASFRTDGKRGDKEAFKAAVKAAALGGLQDFLDDLAARRSCRKDRGEGDENGPINGPAPAG